MSLPIVGIHEPGQQHVSLFCGDWLPTVIAQNPFDIPQQREQRYAMLRFRHESRLIGDIRRWINIYFTSIIRYYKKMTKMSR
jgi:hypothetical protein